MKKKARIEHLPFRSLALDPEYQRRVIPARVKHLVKNWSLDDVGQLLVSLRNTPTGKRAYVIDGQHRWRAAMEQGLGDTKVECKVFEGLTLPEEARKFLAANDARKVTPFDTYRAALAAGDPDAIGVRDICAEHELTVVHGGGTAGTVASVTTLLSIYKKDPALLDGTLGVLTEAWGTRSEAVERPLLGGVSILLDRFGSDVDKGALAKKLGKYRGGPGGLIGDARGLAELKSSTQQRAVAEVMASVYDKGRRNGSKLGPL